jgi:beta-phosphoglucomutase
MKKIKAIVFDMDGVLIDAKEWHYEALNRALNIFGEEIQRWEHNSIFDGLSTKNKLELLSKHGRIPKGMQKFLNELKQKYTMEITVTHCRPNFIHQYAFSKLKEEGFKLAVASNSIRNTVRTMMELSALLPYLDFYLSNEDVKKPKPNPDIYLDALQRLGLEPNEILVLEDNKHGLEAAQEAKCNVLEIKTVEDANYKNIRSFISKIEAQVC